MAHVGVELEDRVAVMLGGLQQQGQIDVFNRHEHHSDEDHAGRDFTIWKIVGGERVEKTFGVTISMRRWNYSKCLHPDVKQFCFPIGTNDTTIQRRILELFE